MENKQVVSDNISRTLGKDAQRTNILAARVVADIVKTTLGPKGMDKMLVDSSGNITVTNDGVTILEQLDIDHPAAKMMVEIAKTQEMEIGDGTTTAALL
ncbi:MAG: TCP-1/cpn60 chaperonin family protein, partial [Nanoarchaeota archaeon]